MWNLYMGPEVMLLNHLHAPSSACAVALSHWCLMLTQVMIKLFEQSKHSYIKCYALLSRMLRSRLFLLFPILKAYLLMIRVFLMVFSVMYLPSTNGNSLRHSQESI